MDKTEALLDTLITEIQEMHKTIGEGMLAIQRALLKQMSPADIQAALHPEPEPEVEEKPEPEKKETDLAMEVSKDISTWIEEHPGCTAAEVVKEHHISLNRATAAVKKYGKKVPKKTETPPLPESLQKVHADAKITIEKLRAKISEFAEAFSMNEALAINEQFGGSRKVSGIPEVKYEFVFSEMDRRLKEKAAPPAAEPEAAPTKEDVQKAAGAFVKEFGDPAFRAVLKNFVAKGEEAKISKVDPAKYAALIEALTNA